MDSEKLRAVLKQLEDQGVSWEKIEEATKVPPQLIRLYAVGGPVPGRIVKKLEELAQAA